MGHPESNLRTRIRDAIRKAGGLCLVYHGSVNGYRGHSDLYGVFRSRPFFLEVKMPGYRAHDEKSLARLFSQQAFLTDAQFHGAVASFVESVDEAIGVLSGQVPSIRLDRYLPRRDN